MSKARTPVRDRLLARCEVRGECWIYTGPTTKDGYGVIGVGRGRGSQRRAHRAAYEEFIGPIPRGMLVCHRCDTPRCIKPNHLFLGTPKDNTQDMLRKSRRPSQAGERHPSAKLSNKQALEIRQRRAAGEKLSTIARDYGISFQHVSAIARGVVYREDS